MNDMQDWESTPEEYIETYSFIDKEQIYTNGSKLISVFRVKQMLEHYYKERTCKPIAKPNVWGFCDFYCECGNKLLEIANGTDEYLPNYCSNCGTKVVK